MRMLIAAPLTLALLGGVATANAVDDEKTPPKVQVSKELNTYEIKVTGMT